MLEPISIIIPSYRTRGYLPLAVRAAREFLASPDHEIIVVDDASEDGSWDWLVANQARYRLVLMRTEGTVPRGLVHTFDEAAREARCDYIWYVHPDMVLGPECDRLLFDLLEPRTVVCPTRIEPPLFPPSPAVLTRDWGTTADLFEEGEFLAFCRAKCIETRSTDGIFSPFLCSKSDFFAVGGHDPAFAPFYREDSDLYGRLQRAGCRFRQSWAAYAYHFVGRSGRQHSDPAERARWTAVAAKNDRVFIRRWGALPATTEYLRPISPSRIPIALEVDMRNEREHVVEFFEHLEPYFEQVIVVDDESTDGSLEALQAWIAERAAADPWFRPERFHMRRRPLGGDFARQIDFGSSISRCEWILHADLDERFDPALLESLQATVRDLGAKGLLVCGFPRLDYLDGVLVNDLLREDWTEDGLASRRSERVEEKGANPDHQFRLYRRGVAWLGRVHEKPRCCFDAPWAVTVRAAGVIRHAKTVARQKEQDERYRTLEAAAGRVSAGRRRWLFLDTESLLGPDEPPPVPGFVRRLARALADLGQEVHVLTPGPGAAAYQENHPVHRAASLPFAPDSPRTRALQENIGLTEAGMRLADRTGPIDVVHALHWTDGLVARSVARRTGAKLIVTCHGPPEHPSEDPERSYVREMEEWMRQEADIVVMGGEAEGIPPGVDVATKHPDPQILDLLRRRLLPGSSAEAPFLTLVLRGPRSPDILDLDGLFKGIVRETAARTLVVGLGLPGTCSAAFPPGRGAMVFDVREPVLSAIFSASDGVLIVDPHDATGHLAMEACQAGVPVSVPLGLPTGPARVRVHRPSDPAALLLAGAGDQAVPPAWGWEECARAYRDLLGREAHV